MTAAAYQRQLEQTTGPELHARRYRALKVYFLAVGFAACQLAGIAALVQAYSIAQTTLSNTSEFVWFWLGMFLLELPLAGMIARRATPPAMRVALLILYGLVTYAPKLLRNPAGPIYHDEFAHWRATEEILNTGKLFQPNPLITIIARYPGLHATTAGLVNATGLTIWQAGVLLLIFLHVMLVLGVASLAQSLGLDNRTSSIAAILYALNSSFLYFDTQYAYESMAITLVVWTLVAYVRAIRSRPARERFAWGVLTIVLSVGTVVTHHLSTITLVAIMALVSLALSLPLLARGQQWGRTALTAWSLTLVSALAAGAWFRFVAPRTWSYLSPFVGQGLSELMQVVNGSGNARQLFGASLSPSWEQKSAYLVPVFALAAALGGLLLLRARTRGGQLPQGRRRALLFAFAFLGLVYFPSTVFILSSAGAEGARRSWAYSWIGLCVLVSPAAVWTIDWARSHALRWRRISIYSALLTTLAVVLVGGTAAGVDASYRFPGPFLYGSDARSVTSEQLAVSRWFTSRFGTGNNVVTDRYTSLIFGSIGLQNPAGPSNGFPVYNLYIARPGAPIEPAFLLFDLANSDYTYLIVDERMAYDTPEIGVYFTPGDPTSILPKNGKSPFSGTLAKFDTIQWMAKVFQSNNYSIYRLNLPAAKVVYQPRAPMAHGKILHGRLTVGP